MGLTRGGSRRARWGARWREVRAQGPRGQRAAAEGERATLGPTSERQPRGEGKPRRRRGCGGRAGTRGRPGETRGTRGVAAKRQLEGRAWSTGGLEGRGGGSGQHTNADALIWGSLMTVLHFLPLHRLCPRPGPTGGRGQSLSL